MLFANVKSQWCIEEGNNYEKINNNYVFDFVCFINIEGKKFYIAINFRLETFFVKF